MSETYPSALESPPPTLSQADWSLHRKGPADQARHNEKIKDAVRKNLADIVSEQSIITSDGRHTLRTLVLCGFPVSTSQNAATTRFTWA